MTRIAIASFSRAEYNVARAVLRAFVDLPNVITLFVIGGEYLHPNGAPLLAAIERDGFEIAARLPFWPAHSDGLSICDALGSSLPIVARTLAVLSPDLLLLCGDRVELLSVATAALLTKTPIGHISGGEITSGAIDDQVRHSLTKLSHLHFVSTLEHRDRVLQLGEEAWRVHVTGDPGLDGQKIDSVLDRTAVERTLGCRLDDPIALVTYHPTTLASDEPLQEWAELAAALDDYPGSLVITGSNADSGGDDINSQWREFCRRVPRASFVNHAGTELYRSLLSIASVMIGNSSSGIWEAPSYGLAVVNIGRRQEGRLRATNVIDVDVDRRAILRAIHSALTPQFKAVSAQSLNPYGDGQAGKRIADALVMFSHDARLLRKGFVDVRKIDGNTEESCPR